MLRRACSLRTNEFSSTWERQTKKRSKSPCREKHGANAGSGGISPHAKRCGAIASPSMAVTATSAHGNQGDIDVALASVAAQ